MKQPLRLISCVLVALFVTASRAGEPVQIKGSTAIELPKPKREIEDKSRSRLNDRDDGAAVFLAPPAQSSGPLDKKLKELLDKKRNWIFLNPYEEHFDAKTERFLEAEKGTGLAGHRWMLDEQKSTIEKFLAEKDKHPGENPDGKADIDRPDNNKSLFGAESDEALNAHAPLFERQTAIPSMFESDRNGDRPLLERLERPSFAERPFAEKKPALSAFEREDLKRQQQTREAELDQLFQPRTGGLFGRAELKTPLSLTPSSPGAPAPSRTEPLLGINRGPSSFLSGERSGAAANLPSRSVLEDVAPKADKGLNFSTSGNNGPAIQQQTIAPSPFVLPFPQRKFY